MSHDRSDRILLDPEFSRCEPLNGPCTVKSRCARYQAYIPVSGGQIEDFTAGQFAGGTAGCMGLILLADLHTAAVRPRPAAKPSIKGIA